MKKIFILILSLMLIGCIGYFVYPYVTKNTQKEEVTTPVTDKKPEIKKEEPKEEIKADAKENGLAVQLKEIKNKEKLSAEDVYVLLKASNLVDETNKYTDDTKKYIDYRVIKQAINVGSYVIFEFEGKKGDFKSIEGDRSDSFLKSVEELDKNHPDAAFINNMFIMETGNSQQIKNVQKIIEKQAPLTEEELYESKEQKEIVKSFKDDDFLTFAKKYFKYEGQVKANDEIIAQLDSILHSRRKEIKGYVIEVKGQYIKLYLKENWEKININDDSKNGTEQSFVVFTTFENTLIPNAIKPGDEIEIYAKFKHAGQQNKKTISEWGFRDAEVLKLNGKKVKQNDVMEEIKDMTIDEKDKKRIREFIKNVEKKKKDQLVIVQPNGEKDIVMTLIYTNKLYYKSNISTFESESLNKGAMDRAIYPIKTYTCENVSVESYNGTLTIKTPYERIQLNQCNGPYNNWEIYFDALDKIK